MQPRSVFFSFSFIFLAATSLAPYANAANNAAAVLAPVPSPLVAAARAASAQPRPDQTKIYTNDDLSWSAPATEPSSASSPSTTDQTAAAPQILSAEKDPQWYAQQVAVLQADLDAVQSQATQLRLYRTNKTDLPTGLVVHAPVEGITTDDLIAKLDARAAELTQRLDDLADLARVNGLPPGVVNQPALPEEVFVATPETIVADYQQTSDQLAQTQAALASMQEGTAARNISLLPSNPANGGNLTTDLMDRLNQRASALQQSLNDTEDVARAQNIAPGDLR